LIKKEGWCAPSSDALQVDFDDDTTVDEIEITRVGGRPLPNYIRLDYLNLKGVFKRYLTPSGSDVLNVSPNGRIRITRITSRSFKLRQVFSAQDPPSKSGCIRFEFYTCGTHSNQRVILPSPVIVSHSGNVELEFGFGNFQDEWTMFRFEFYQNDPNTKTYLKIKKIDVNWRVDSANGEHSGFTDVKIRLRHGEGRSQDKEFSKAEFTNYRTSTFEIEHSSNTGYNSIDLLFHKEDFCHIWLKCVKFYLTSEEIITFTMAGDSKQKSGRYSVLIVNPVKHEILVVAPIGAGNSYQELAFQGHLDWQNEQSREFNSEYAVGDQIHKEEFQQTVHFEQNDTTHLWHAKFDENQDGRLAIRFPSNIEKVRIATIVAGDQIHAELESITPTAIYSGTDEVTAATTNTETLAGIVVGIVGALIVIIFVACILIWRKRQQDFPDYATGRERACSPIYPHTQPLVAQNVDLIPRGISLPNQMRYATPRNFYDQIPQQDRRRTAPVAYSPHRRQASNQSHIGRPLIPTPEVNEDPIYEPPANFRDQSRRIYGPIGTIRYASPEALRTKEPPPTIAAEHVKALEELGAGEFGEVMLVEAPINCFPRLDRSDLPAGATKVLAALKRLKNNSSPETKKIFLDEANLMYGLRHRNILPLLAVIPDIPALLTGYSEHGDLRQYLRRRLTCQDCDSDDPGFISYKSLLDVSVQIAAAMEYLESVRVVHRDLAARNCFVGRGLRVRVGDFGMSRNLYSKDYFKVTGNVVMPIRWSAWESIILGNFTTKSDVWSFGVTVYEVYILCRERPLEMLSDEQVIQRMVALYKDQSTITCGMVPWLPRPSDCPEETWEVIQTCWQRDEASRPSFKKLHMQLRRQTIANDCN